MYYVLVAFVSFGLGMVTMAMLVQSSKKDEGIDHG